MATIGNHSSAVRNPARPPISRHRAFPAIVATWFAALFGAGSVVLPAASLETIIEAAGIDALVPAAAPPLGVAARGVIALVLALSGGLAGVAVARRVARVQGGDHPRGDAGFAVGARRPIRINEELGGAGLVNGFSLPVTQDRAQAIAEDDRPGDGLYMAPLPDSDECNRPLTFNDDMEMDLMAAVYGGDAAEPLAFSAPSLARRAHPRAEAEPAAVGEPGLVQLVDRLGASIRRRRDTFAHEMTEATVPGGIDAALRAALATLQRANGAA